jgi:hypothetical protein
MDVAKVQGPNWTPQRKNSSTSGHNAPKDTRREELQERLIDAEADTPTVESSTALLQYAAWVACKVVSKTVAFSAWQWASCTMTTSESAVDR